jgi:hypothetical protein
MSFDFPGYKDTGKTILGARVLVSEKHVGPPMIFNSKLWGDAIMKSEDTMKDKMTIVAEEASKLSMTLTRLIDYLYQTQFDEIGRVKIIRDILNDNFFDFHIRVENAMIKEETKTD